MFWFDAAIADIANDEGDSLVAYQDGGGVWTIGRGHTRGVKPGDTCTAEQSRAWLTEDATIALVDLNTHLSWWQLAPDSVRRGLLNMCFNLGWPRLSGFKRMLAAGESKQYLTMADEAEQSAWAEQVGQRSTRIANLFRAAAQMELAV